MDISKQILALLSRFTERSTIQLLTKTLIISRNKFSPDAVWRVKAIGHCPTPYQGNEIKSAQSTLLFYTSAKP